MEKNETQDRVMVIKYDRLPFDSSERQREIREKAESQISYALQKEDEEYHHLLDQCRQKYRELHQRTQAI